MAKITRNVYVLGSEVNVSFTYDDATMLLTGASVTNSSGKSLQLDILSPRTHSVTIPAGNRAVSIPSNRRPTWEYADQNIPQGGTRRIITGVEWKMGTVNN